MPSVKVEPSRNRRRPSGIGAQQLRQRTGGNGFCGKQRRRQSRRRQDGVGMAENKRAMAKKAAISAFVHWRGRCARMVITEAMSGAPRAQVHRAVRVVRQKLRKHRHADGQPHGGQCQPCHKLSLPAVAERCHPQSCHVGHPTAGMIARFVYRLRLSGRDIAPQSSLHRILLWCQWRFTIPA